MAFATAEAGVPRASSDDGVVVGAPASPVVSGVAHTTLSRYPAAGKDVVLDMRALRRVGLDAVEPSMDSAEG